MNYCAGSWNLGLDFKRVEIYPRCILFILLPCSYQLKWSKPSLTTLWDWLYWTLNLAHVILLNYRRSFPVINIKCNLLFCPFLFRQSNGLNKPMARFRIPCDSCILCKKNVFFAGNLIVYFYWMHYTSCTLPRNNHIVHADKNIQ